MFKQKNIFSQLNFYSLLSLVSGALLPLAFAPFNYFWLAILCPAILLRCWLNCTQHTALWRGFLFGIGFFGVGVSWVYISIHQYGNTQALLAGIITALFITILAIYPAVQGYVLTRFFPQTTFSKLVIAFPCTWALFEWVRGWFLTGFPWLFLGASQINSPLRGFAPVVGELGLAFIITCCSALVFIFGENLLAIFFKNFKKNNFLFTKKYFYLSTLLFVLIWMTGLALSHIQWTQPKNNSIKISIIQGNIPQQLKWDPVYLENTLNRYYRLTNEHWDSRIIIWPEAAIPLIDKDARNFLDKLTSEAKQHQATLITGIPVQDGFTYYNAMLALGSDNATYYKRHLVPFGEYVPFENILRGLIGLFDIPMSNFAAGTIQQPTFKVADTWIAPFICYEIVYADIVLSELPQAELLLTISNDAWFGHSFAAQQHLQIGQLRALETGRYLIFSTNDGVTAIVNSQGKITQQIAPYHIGVLTTDIQPMQGTTPWVKIGTTPIIICLMLLLIIAWRFNQN